jgi:hypothetical protein
MDLEQLPIRDYLAIMWRYAEILNELEGTRVAVLEGICHETFDDFLPAHLKSTEPSNLPTLEKAEQLSDESEDPLV